MSRDVEMDCFKKPGECCPFCGAAKFIEWSILTDPFVRWTCEGCGTSGYLGTNRKITPPPVSAAFCFAVPQACDACTKEGTCSRIGQCLRYKCEFGKVDKP